MKACFRSPRLRYLLASAAAGVIVTAAPDFSQAANVFLTSDDASGSSSYNTAGNWSPSQVPGSTAGDDYYAATAVTGGTAHAIRTPSGVAGTLVFGDITKDTLHLVGAGSNLRLKSNGGATFSVALVMDNSSAITNDAATANFTFTGSLTVNASVANPAQIHAVNNSATGSRTLTINSSILGAGNLRFNRAGATGSILIGSEGNSYSGDVQIDGTNLTLAKDLALGTADITMTVNTSGGTFNPTLTLSGGTTNNYIANTASLTVPTGGVVNLNFVGTDNIASLTIAGTTYTSGVFGADTSGGAQNPGGVFTGTGFLAVPEPATLGLLSLVGAIMLRRRHT